MAHSSSREDTALSRLVHGLDSDTRWYFLSKLDNLLGPIELNRAGSSSITWLRSRKKLRVITVAC